MPKNNIITKAIIPVGGLGTRFLPVTKAQPKEMLPIIDKPVIQYIVEEAVKSGIKDIILVTNYNKRAIEDHFSPNPDLLNNLRERNKTKKLKEIEKITKLANFIYVRQDGPYGTGTPILNAEHLIGDEPFAVLYGDDLFLSKKPRLKQLMDVYYKYKSPVLTAYEVGDEETEKYGIIEGESQKNGVIKVNKILEKPGPKKTESRIASLGGYILTPEIFQILKKTPINKKAKELFLTDAIYEYMKKKNVYACKIDGEYFDTGNPLEWLKTNLAFAKNKDGMKRDFKKIVNEVMNIK
ncbi:UTP--glucose-1-phosphate uridylyltransferase [Patescibacteria group bacterium]|nr:UTP--glucose-1-phosphate uridylyltransferase [Patescibacteria group bacterium]